MWVTGKKRKAIRYFERAVAQARRLDTPWDLACGLLDLAAVKQEGRDENRREAIKVLKEIESVIPYAERWLLGDEPDMDVVAPSPDELAAELASASEPKTS